MLDLKGLTGCVVLPGSPCYDEARKNYNGCFNKFPLIIVYCSVKQDVVNAILWVRRRRLPFRIRGGGNSYEAYSLVNGGLVIDVSGLQDLQINNENLTMRAGAGLRLPTIYESLWDQGFAVPGGTCPTVCVSGLTLGGGFGLLSRLFGMLCDNLLEVEMVTALGEVILANDYQHSDLLWACRGGSGGNFGAVTSLTFRVHPIGNVARFRMTWNFSDLEKLVRFWQAWAPFTDPRLTPLMALPARNQGDLRCSGVFVGSEQELRQLLRPLQEATNPKTAEFYSTTWIEAARLYAGVPLKQEKFKHSSACAYEPLPDEALRVLTHNLLTVPGPINVVTFDPYGGSVSQIPDHATAFVHRKALFVIQYLSYWYQDGDADKNIRWIEQFRKSMLLYTKGAYSNYCDCQIADWPTAYFGGNLAGLMDVKKKYDPENLFCYEQSIPLSFTDS